MIDPVLGLMLHSKLHRNYTIEQINRLVMPPVNLNQNLALYEGRCLVAWSSWAFMDERLADKFLDSNHKMQPEDWCSGEFLVVMDYVAPFGHAKKLYRAMRDLFKDQKQGAWVRHTKGHRRVELTDGR